MNDKSYIEWDSMSDSALAKHIGVFVRHHRMEKMKTQQQLAIEAGISRSTLSLLERGETVTLATLIQVIRVLDQLHIMDVFTVNLSPSPLELVKLQRNKRQRSRNKSKIHQPPLENDMDW